jgi:hypothetical protein
LGSSNLEHVSLGVKDADISDLPPATKSEISITDVVSFAWSVDDIVGMFPNKGAQAYFEMAEFQGESQAYFDGGGWALKAASEYAVYYPYDYDHRDRAQIPFNYQGQSQQGVNDFSHLSKWQYLAQGMQQPEGGACNYKMERIEAIVIFKLTFPSLINCDQLSMRIASGQKVIHSTHLNISESNFTVSPSEDANQFTLALEDVSITEINKPVYFYAMMPPQDFAGQKIIISVHSTDGDNYLAAVDGKNMLYNHAYQYEATLTSDYASFMEMYGLEEGFWE